MSKDKKRKKKLPKREPESNIQNLITNLNNQGVFGNIPTHTLARNDHGTNEERHSPNCEMNKIQNNCSDYYSEGTSHQIPIGPKTRLQEAQINLQSSRKSCDNGGYSLLTKFDEFYKDKRNLINEAYVHKPPVVDREYNQVDLAQVLNNKNITALNKKYALESIPKEDLDYYLKFVDYYQNEVGNGNIFLRGVHSFETCALELLKSCKYDIKVALIKILFPVMDRINCLTYSDKEINVYTSSALNDLIGSNNQEKEEWIKYITESLNKKIDISELQTLIDIGYKMKIDIPPNVQTEIKNSMKLCKIIKDQLSNKNNTLNEISQLYEISQTYKVQTEEFANLGELIKKTKNWEKKLDEIDNQCVIFKSLLTLYNEGKSLPFKFEGEMYQRMKTRYEAAHYWQDLFSKLPKHSKTRQQGSSNQSERCTLDLLAKMIITAEEVNFTSNEVEGLKKNYELLCQAEKKIEAALNDDCIVKTKDLLKDFVNILDNLRFTTNLYDVVESKLALIEWNEKREQVLENSKVIKMKHLKTLVKMSEQKHLSNLPEIIEFKDLYNSINSWVEKMIPIFYLNSSEEEYGGKINSNAIQSNINTNGNVSHNSNANGDQMLIDNPNENPQTSSTSKITQQELIELYNQGKAFKYIPIECEDLLKKCKEIFEFIADCKNAIESTSKEAKDYNRLFDLREIISSYNIQCDDFDYIEQQSNEVLSWIKESEDFVLKYKKLSNYYYTLNPEINSLEERQSNITLIEEFIKNGEVYYEKLISLLDKIPPFAMNTDGYNTLLSIKYFAKTQMMVDIDNPSLTLKEITDFINEMQKYCVSKEFLTHLLLLYRKKSWLNITSIIKKMTLNDADKLLKEANSLSLNNNEMDVFKENVTKTKDWIKQEKRILNSDKISYNNLKKLINEGEMLPLYTDEIEKLKDFKENIQAELTEVKDLLFSKPNYEQIENMMNKINNCIVDTEEFDILTKLKAVVEDWTNVANKILSSRELCQLYFKSKEVPDLIDNYSNVDGIDNNLPMSNPMLSLNNEAQIALTPFLGRKRRNDNQQTTQNPAPIIVPNQVQALGINPQKSKVDAESLLNLLNTISFTNQKLNSFEKKFLNSSYEDRYKIIAAHFILIDDAGKHYCICRQGDDDLNSMIMCDICKEWFHFKCLKIHKATAATSKNYYCLLCSRRKDLYNNEYHNEFFTHKRISNERLTQFVMEGIEIQASFPQLIKLKELKAAIDKWNIKYSKALNEIITFYHDGNEHLNENYERTFSNLYLESEGFCAETKNWYNTIVVIKQSDWFKDAYKCLEGKKQSEKNIKKLLINAHVLFNYDYITKYTEIEQRYFDMIIAKGIKLVNELNQKNLSWNITGTNNNNGGIVQSVVMNTTYANPIGHLNRLSKNDIDNEEREDNDKEMNVDDVGSSLIENNHEEDNDRNNDELAYIEWRNNMKEALLSGTASTEDIKELFNDAKIFNIKSEFIRKVKSISIDNVTKMKAHHYYSILFTEDNDEDEEEEDDDDNGDIEIEENDCNEDGNLNMISNKYTIEKRSKSNSSNSNKKL